MHLRLAVVLVAAFFVGVPRIVEADPITYDFTGTFNQPYNGSKTFSGSFTFNANPTLPFPTATSVTENGPDTSLTLNAGGTTMSFQNDSHNPFTTATVTAQVVPPIAGEPTVALIASGDSNGQLDVGISFYSPANAAALTNLQSMSLPLLGSSFLFSSDGTFAPRGGGEGQITSIEPVSTPEPSTLCVFAGLGLLAVVRRHRHRIGHRVPRTS